MEDQCERCAGEHEFIVLIERDDNNTEETANAPVHAQTVKLCGACLAEANGVIDSWTIAEWRNT